MEKQRTDTENTRKDIRRELTDALIERIESGTAPWQKQWDPSIGDDTPINAVTGKRYRGINNFWLMLHQPDGDPRWCTFKQAQDQGWKIRKGSHGVTIEKWVVVEKSKEIDVNGDSAILEEKHLAVRYYTVFHASQVDGIPELERSQASEVSLDPDERVAKTASSMGVPVVHAGNRAYYNPASDSITLPTLDSFATAADYDTVLLHEIGHATGHKSRLNRDLNNTFGSPEYAKEELRAEISAAMNARVLGISFDPTQVDTRERSGLENSAAYLKNWLSAIPEQDRKPELMAAISSAQKISDYVLGFALKEDLDEELESHVSIGPRMRL